MGEDDTSNGYAAGTGGTDTISDKSGFLLENFTLDSVWSLSEDVFRWFDRSPWFAAWSTESWYGFSTTRLQTPEGCRRSLGVGTVPPFTGAVLLTFVMIHFFKRSIWQSVRNRCSRKGRRVSCENHIFGNLPYEQGCHFKPYSKTLNDCDEEDELLSLLNSDTSVTLTTPYFYVKNGVLHLAGYDAARRKWFRLPPLDYLPDDCAPDPDLFKQFLVCTHVGIVCMNVSKSSKEKLVVFNLITRKWRLLPSLNHRRNPVLMHLVVDAAIQSFQIIVAGSSKAGDEHLSRITEVFDSTTWTWTRTGDIPGPDYALNDYQSGVFKGGFVFCVAFLSEEPGRGILRYNLSKGTWLKNWTYPLPFAVNSPILQLVENGGEVFLFSEQESQEGIVQHCVDVLECAFSDDGVESCNLRNIVRNKKLGGRSLEIYPEYVCVGFSDFQLCIFHTIDHSGVVFDVKRCEVAEILDAPVGKGFCGDRLDSLNPLSFAIQPNTRYCLD